MGCNQSTPLSSVTEQFDDVKPGASDGVEGSSGTSVDEGEGGDRESDSIHACPLLPALRSGKKSSENFSVDLWNAFDDGTVVALKTADEKRYVGIVAVANFFLDTLDSLAQSMASIIEDHDITRTGIPNKLGEVVTIDTLLPAVLPDIVAFSERRMTAKTALESEVLEPWNACYRTHKIVVEELEDKYQCLVDDLAEQEENCNHFQREYEDACALVEKSIQSRDVNADGNSLEARDRLKAHLIASIAAMIDSEKKYKLAIEKFHGFQKRKQNETCKLLEQFQVRMESHAVETQTYLLRLVDYIRGIGEYTVAHFTDAQATLTLFSVEDEATRITQTHKSVGIFDAKLRSFLSAESNVVTKQRKQFALAQKAFKLETGKAGEDSFVEMMNSRDIGIARNAHEVNSTLSSISCAVETPSEQSSKSVKHMEANSLTLSAQSRWKSKHGLVDDENALKKTEIDTTTTLKRRVARPSFKKPSLP